jgi:hypothetical protein
MYSWDSRGAAPGRALVGLLWGYSPRPSGATFTVTVGDLTHKIGCRGTGRGRKARSAEPAA